MRTAARGCGGEKGRQVPSSGTLAGKSYVWREEENRCLDGEKACRAGKGDRAPQGDGVRTELAKP
jgi:hypothetical protein